MWFDFFPILHGNGTTKNNSIRLLLDCCWSYDAVVVVAAAAAVVVGVGIVGFIDAVAVGTVGTDGTGVDGAAVTIVIAAAV